MLSVSAETLAFWDLKVALLLSSICNLDLIKEFLRVKVATACETFIQLK